MGCIWPRAYLRVPPANADNGTLPRSACRAHRRAEFRLAAKGCRNVSWSFRVHQLTGFPQIGDELLKQRGEFLRCLPMRGMPSSRDDLYAAAPQARGGKPSQVVPADQLLAVTRRYGERLTEPGDDGYLVGEPAFADARAQALARRAVGARDVGRELIQGKLGPRGHEIGGIGQGILPAYLGTEAKSQRGIGQEGLGHLRRVGRRGSAEYEEPGRLRQARGGFDPDVGPQAPAYEHSIFRCEFPREPGQRGGIAGQRVRRPVDRGGG